MNKESKYSSIHYANYLQLDKLLDAQKLRSAAISERPAHEEMLFIILHQVYELWFKQINHELSSVMHMFSGDNVNERSINVAVARLDRVVGILKILIQQIRIMETMTPLDFLEFRNYLFPASGFQSFQFRVLEVTLGLRKSERHKYTASSYTEVFDDQKRKELEALENSPSLLDLIESWLERTPFLKFHGFDFLNYYKKAVKKMLKREKHSILSSEILSEDNKENRLKMLEGTDNYFDSLMNPELHKNLVEKGEIKFSYKATIALLLIYLYRDEPILQMPYQLLSKLTDIDEFLTSWRYRHAQMVLRMLGRKIGTGGSSGHDYLLKTIQKHQIFSDLYNISTFLIPRSELPDLPEEMKKNLGFYFTSNG